jgi:hypothetical protein
MSKRRGRLQDKEYPDNGKESKTLSSKNETEKYRLRGISAAQRELLFLSFNEFQ